MSYWETLFDSRFVWDAEWKQRRDIIETEEQLGAVQDAQTVTTARLQRQIHDLSVTVMALVELLSDDGKLDAQELRARVQAAVIGEEHERRKTADSSQDAWDAGKPKR